VSPAAADTTSETRGALCQFDYYASELLGGDGLRGQQSSLMLETCVAQSLAEENEQLSLALTQDIPLRVALKVLNPAEPKSFGVFSAEALRTPVIAGSVHFACSFDDMWDALAEKLSELSFVPPEPGDVQILMNYGRFNQPKSE
jgi:hypothetical protein